MINEPITSASENYSFSHLLLVEGSDEVAFFQALLQFLEIPNVRVEETQGISGMQKKWKQQLAIISNQSAPAGVIKKIALVKDADLKGTDEVFIGHQSWLKQNNYPFPAENGTFSNPDANQLAVGIFIMPGDQMGIMLEDLCLGELQESQRDCLDAFITCYGLKEKTNENDRPESRYPKYKFRIHMVTNHNVNILEIHKNIRLALSSEMINFNHSVFDQVKAFLLSFGIDNI